MDCSEPRNLSFQTGPGDIQQEPLEALDFVMETARKHGLKVMLSFADNWKFLGARRQSSAERSASLMTRSLVYEAATTHRQQRTLK